MKKKSVGGIKMAKKYWRLQRKFYSDIGFKNDWFESILCLIVEL